MPALEIKNLEYRYAHASDFALQQINIHLEKGQCLGLIGPNGAGKSTLLSLLSGLFAPTSGTIYFDQSDGQSPPLTLAKFVQQKVALVPQEYAFYPQLNVVQNLKYFASLCGFDKAKSQSRVLTVTQQCQLQTVCEQPAKFLSGGYKRRLNLAIALLKDPQILYLDEPTVGVDPISRESILSLLIELKNQGKTIIYTSHLLAEVQNICDKIVMLNLGKAHYLNLAEGEKHLSIELTNPLPTHLIDQIASLPIKVDCHDKQIQGYLNSTEDLFAIISLLGNNPLSIQTIHYEPISLDQFYLKNMEKNDNSEH